LKFYKP